MVHKPHSDPNSAGRLSILRRFASNLAIREAFLSRWSTPRVLSKYGISVDRTYSVGPTILWTEDSADLSIFTSQEGFDHFWTFEEPYNDPRTKTYLGKLLRANKRTKGSILIKERTSPDTPNIPVHFCAYRVDDRGQLTIFDPSWHRADPGIYSTTAFYETLDAFRIPYTHWEPNRTHHWQSVLPHDVYCQTWTLWWLFTEGQAFPLPKTPAESAEQLQCILMRFAGMVLRHHHVLIPLFPKWKWEGETPDEIFSTIPAIPL